MLLRLFLGALLFISNLASAQVLPVSNLEVDLSPLFEMAGKSSTEIVESLLKEHKIKVVVEADDEPIDRILEDKLVIRVPRSYTTSVLLHEYARYLMTQARGEKARKVDGQKYSWLGQFVLRQRELVKKEELLDLKIKSPKSDYDAVMAIAERTIVRTRRLLEKFDFYYREAAEELDITRLFAEEASRLKLSQNDHFNAYSSHRDRLQKTVNDLAELRRGIEEPSFLHAVQVIVEAHRIYEDIVRKMDAFDDRCQEDVEWLQSKGLEFKALFEKVIL
jgi:hypothetical protein